MIDLVVIWKMTKTIYLNKDFKPKLLAMADKLRNNEDE